MVNKLILESLWKESTSSWQLLKSILQVLNFQSDNLCLLLTSLLLRVFLLFLLLCLGRGKGKDSRIQLHGINRLLGLMLKLDQTNSLKKLMKRLKEERKHLKNNKRRSLKQRNKKMMMTFSEMMTMPQQQLNQLPNQLSKNKRKKLLLNLSLFSMLKCTTRKKIYKFYLIK